MTDKTPANLTRKEAQAVREWAERTWRTKVQDAVVAHAARVLLAVLPPRPTLADMTPEERAACRRMQADVADHDTRYVIANPHDRHGEAALIAADGEIEWLLPEYVTPRPDLPRLEWPGDTPISPNAVAVGTVIESADDPRIDALPVGSVLLDLDEEATIKGRGDWTGAGYIPIPSEGAELGPWTVLHIPKENPND